MDFDTDFESDDSPRRGTRDIPSRAAKIKAPPVPNRLTRSTAAYHSGSQSGGDDDDACNSNRKRKLRAAKIHDIKRIRRNPPRGQASSSRSGAKVTPSRPTLQVTSRSAPPKSQGNRQERTEVRSKPVTVLLGDWKSMPYHIWLGVFEDLAAPLRNSSARNSDIASATRSLLSAAQAWKELCEPALTALYQSSHLSSPSAAQFLCRLLTTAKPTYIKYRVKIHSLRIEADDVLSRKFGGNYLDLKALIHNLPSLSHLEIYLKQDGEPYRQLDENVRYRYPPELFEAFEPVKNSSSEASDKVTHTCLKSWSWSSRLADESCSLDKLAEIHLKPSFASLRKIAFVNYQVPSLNKRTSRNKDPDEIAAMDEPVYANMARAIAALPDLEHLTLESSTVANTPLLEKLPKNLKHLELINCWDVETEPFTAFLVSHGSSLRQLTLNHCQSLSLAFLPVLGSACPKLTHLSMNLKYFRHHEFYNDNNPFYDQLLTEQDVPVWPSSIQSIDLEGLGYWNRRAAEMFFKTLQDSASTIPLLRRLVLKATIDCPIRERAVFRRHWEAMMEYIFKRPVDEPTCFGRPPPAAPGQHDDELHLSGELPESPMSQNKKYLKLSTNNTRRSARIRTAKHVPSPTTPDSGSRASRRESTRVLQLAKEAKKLRLSSVKRGFTADSDSSEDELVRAQPSHSTRNAPLFKHQKCDVVDVQIDNQRATELQYTNDDFLDDEQQGLSDDDWDGNDYEDDNDVFYF